MRYNKNIGFDGISLFDEFGDQLEYVEWNTRPHGDWTTVVEIPNGKQIVGMMTDAKFLRVGFTYWDIPPYAPGKELT